MIAGFVVNHWRPFAAAAALAAMFFAGRLSVPDKPALVQTQERVVFKDRIVTVEKQVMVKGEDKTKVVYVDREVKPDGTRVEHIVSRMEAVTKTTTNTQTATTKVEQKVTVESSKTTYASPQWRVGALVGVDASRIRLFPPDLGSPVLGAEVSHKVVGGLSVGAWGITSGPTMGLSLSYEF